MFIQSPIPPSTVVSLIIIVMFTYILAPWYGQKIFSASSQKVAFQAVVIASFIISLFYALAILAASTLAKDYLLIESQEAIPFIIQNKLPQNIARCCLCKPVLYCSDNNFRIMEYYCIHSLEP